MAHRTDRRPAGKAADPVKPKKRVRLSMPGDGAEWNWDPAVA